MSKKISKTSNKIGHNNSVSLSFFSFIFGCIKKGGGLGVHHLHTFNQELLGKWLWCFAMEKDALWKRVIATKYGVDWGGWCSKSVAGPQEVCLWKHIQRGRNWFSGSTCFELGLGTNVQFWHDRWCRGRDLKDTFPRLYTFAQRKDAAVADLLSWRADQNVWDVSFYRAMHDWEKEVMSNDQFPFSHLL